MSMFYASDTTLDDVPRHHEIRSRRSDVDEAHVQLQ